MLKLKVFIFKLAFLYLKLICDKVDSLIAFVNDLFKDIFVIVALTFILGELILNKIYLTRICRLDALQLSLIASSKLSYLLLCEYQGNNSFVIINIFVFFYTLAC